MRDILEMACEATKDREGSIDWVFSDEELKRLVKLVRAEEQEARVKLLVKIAQFLGVVRVYAQDIRPKHELETDKPLHWQARELQDEVIRMLDATSPAQIAEPLTDEQLLDILRGIDSDAVRLATGFKAFARAIEARHGITKGQA
jgi:DNA-binding TFAR19-related protein (PDSD5 family)